MLLLFPFILSVLSSLITCLLNAGSPGSCSALPTILMTHSCCFVRLEKPEGRARTHCFISPRFVNALDSEARETKLNREQVICYCLACYSRLLCVKKEHKHWNDGQSGLLQINCREVTFAFLNTTAAHEQMSAMATRSYNYKQTHRISMLELPASINITNMFCGLKILTILLLNCFLTAGPVYQPWDPRVCWIC